MKTKRAPDTKLDAADRDTLIGSAISNAIACSSPVDLCPTTEQLAALVDGNFSGDERDSLLGHMAACERCREIYILSHALSSEEPVQRNNRGWYMAGGTFAAVALVVLAVKLTMQEPAAPVQLAAPAPVQHQSVSNSMTSPNPQVAISPQVQPKEIPFSAAAVARQLAKAASADSLAAFIGASASGSYGFSGSGSQQTTAFQTGKELFELELWLAAGDTERADLARERVLPLLKSVGVDGGATAPLDDLIRQLESGRFDDVIRQLEVLLKPPQREIIRLGSWTAAARVALDTGSDPYFGGNPPKRFLKELGGTLSPAARDILGKLDKDKAGRDLVVIRRLLVDLANAI
jgi:anti-sigma factor RsiW